MEDEEEEEEFLDDLDVEHDWEDLEEWNTSELPVSIINNRWTGVPQCPPPPPQVVPNHLTRPLPPRTSSLSARSLYALNGSLSDSTESLPVQAKLNSL